MNRSVVPDSTGRDAHDRRVDPAVLGALPLVDVLPDDLAFHDDASEGGLGAATARRALQRDTANRSHATTVSLLERAAHRTGFSFGDPR